jgi:hypothetical protein
MPIGSIAVIGSFRQHNAYIQQVCTTIRTAGFIVTSPQGSEIIEDGIPFVRFTSDLAGFCDAAIQSQALHRILRADLVYVVAPDGYVGRTTCYEVGRIIQSRKPIYFSAQPIDLPLIVPESYVANVDDLVGCLRRSDWQPSWLYQHYAEHVGILERELLDGKFRHD